jgi:hypothetical protein
VEPVADPVAAAPVCAEALALVGLDERWCLVGPDGATAGMSRDALRGLASGTDVLLNVSGMLTDADVLDRVPTRAYLDLDPAFVQLWHAVEGIDMRLDAHTHFVTLSDAVGTTIPDCGRQWISTLPPVDLDHWTFAEDLERDALTTVANWRGYGSIHHDGVHYGQKAHSVRPLIDLPRRVGRPVEIALSIHEDEAEDIAALRANGWQIVDPAVAGTPAGYRSFVRGSWAELGIAKSGYVVSRSGWFSDRSACYLAAGRPVVAQDTGFGRRLPTGEGLFAYRCGDDVAAAVDAIAADEERHRGAARELAAAHLDGRLVLSALLEALS